LNLRLFLVRLITLSNLNRFTRSDHRWNRIIEYYILTYNRLQKDRLQPVVDRFFDFSREDATCNWSVAEARQLATAVRSFSVRLRSGCGLFAVLQLDFETLPTSTTPHPPLHVNASRNHSLLSRMQACIYRHAAKVRLPFAFYTVMILRLTLWTDTEPTLVAPSPCQNAPPALNNGKLPRTQVVLPRSGPKPWFEPNFGPVLTQSGPRSRCQPEPDHDMVLGSGRVRTVLRPPQSARRGLLLRIPCMLFYC
jgi:hypothetical protein